MENVKMYFGHDVVLEWTHYRIEEGRQLHHNLVDGFAGTVAKRVITQSLRIMARL